MAKTKKVKAAKSKKPSYLKEVKGEMKKVSFPSAKEVTTYTIATLKPKILINRTSEPKSTIGEDIKNENVTPSGSPALVKPIKSGMDEQEQNGVTVPRSAAIILAQIP